MPPHNEVFLAFSFSVLELVEKVLDQPNLIDVLELVKNIDSRMKKTLDLVESRKIPDDESCSHEHIESGGGESNGMPTPESDSSEHVNKRSSGQHDVDVAASVQSTSYQSI